MNELEKQIQQNKIELSEMGECISDMKTRIDRMEKFIERLKEEQQFISQN